MRAKRNKTNTQGEIMDANVLIKDMIREKDEYEPNLSESPPEKDEYEPNPSGSPLEKDPLKIYLKEIRNNPLLTHEEEIYWARIFCKGRKEKIKLLKRAIEIFNTVQYYKPLNQLLFFSNDSLYEYIHLEESLFLYKKIIRIKNQLSKFCSSREKRKLTKEKLKLKSEFSNTVWGKVLRKSKIPVSAHWCSPNVS